MNNVLVNMFKKAIILSTFRNKLFDLMSGLFFAMYCSFQFKYLDQKRYSVYKVTVILIYLVFFLDDESDSESSSSEDEVTIGGRRKRAGRGMAGKLHDLSGRLLP